MAKNILLYTFLLTFLLQSCTGQHKKESVNKTTTIDSIKKEQLVTPNNTAPLSFVNNAPISQVVRTIFQDSKETLWFGSENGASKLTNSSWQPITGIQSQTGKGVTIKGITATKDGTIWMAHSDGVSSIKGETVRNYYKSDGLISNDTWCIAVDTQDKIWIGTIDGLCIFDGTTFTPLELPEGVKDTYVGISSTKMIHAILQDHNGKIWIASNAGLFSYTDNQLVNESKQFGITTPFVTKLFEDRKGNLWIATKEGLYVVKKGVAQNLTRGKIEIGKGIGSVAEAKDGTIWLVANQHYLYTYDGKELKEFQQKEGIKRPVPFEIYKDQKERLWLVGFGGASRLENGTFIPVTKNGPW